MASLPEIRTVYVQLLKEGSGPTWRPTQGEVVGTDVVRLLASEAYDPAKEIWEFPPGALVRLAPVDFLGKDCEVAIEEFPDGAQPHAVVRARLFATVDGGRHDDTPGERFICRAIFESQPQWPRICMFLLKRAGGPLRPGAETKTVPVRFLDWERLSEVLTVGARFQLHEGKDIGEAEVIGVSPLQRAD